MQMILTESEGKRVGGRGGGVIVSKELTTTLIFKKKTHFKLNFNFDFILLSLFISYERL